MDIVWVLSYNAEPMDKWFFSSEEKALAHKNQMLESLYFNPFHFSLTRHRVA